MLLRHEMPATSHLGSHWDLMFDSGDLLLTFRLSECPAADDHDLQVERLADHRRLYLEYEGEISGGRGRISRVASGNFRRGELLPDEPNAPLAVCLHSPELMAELLIEPCPIGAKIRIGVRSWIWGAAGKALS